MILAASEGAAPALIELGALLLVLAALARLSSRVGLSPIPLYLVAGLLLGEGGLFGLSASEDFLQVAATLGVVLLLLMLGLEYTSEELVANLRSNGAAGAVDLLNAVPGLVLGIALGWSTEEIIALGGITYISSSGIIAKVLGDLDRLGNRETPTVLSLLVIEDLVMALYLPLLVGLGLDRSAVATGLTTGGAIVAVLLVLVVALRFGQPISRVLASRSDEVLLFGIVGLGLLVAGLAELVNVSGAIGAFLVGIAVSGAVAEHGSELISPLRDLFAAAFFIVFAFQIDPADLWGVLALAVALAVVTAAGKLATTWWATARAGIGPRGRLRAGTAMMARGEFSIVIAGIAVGAGARPELGTLAAAYVLLLAVLGPLAARFGEPVALRLAPGRFGGPPRLAPTESVDDDGAGPDGPTATAPPPA